MAFAGIPILGDVLGGVLDLIRKRVKDKDLAARMEHELVQALLAGGLEELRAQTSVVLAEAGGESWLQRNWRPVLMLTIVAIVANNYLVYPYLRLFWQDAPVLELPGHLYDLMKIGVGGYVVGRSAEKIVRIKRNE